MDADKVAILFSFSLTLLSTFFLVFAHYCHYNSHLFKKKSSIRNDENKRDDMIIMQFIARPLIAGKLLYWSMGRVHSLTISQSKRNDSDNSKTNYKFISSSFPLCFCSSRVNTVYQNTTRRFFISSPCSNAFLLAF